MDKLDDILSSPKRRIQEQKSRRQKVEKDRLRYLAVIEAWAEVNPGPEPSGETERRLWAQVAAEKLAVLVAAIKKAKSTRCVHAMFRFAKDTENEARLDGAYIATVMNGGDPLMPEDVLLGYTILAYSISRTKLSVVEKIIDFPPGTMWWGIFNAPIPQGFFESKNAIGAIQSKRTARSALSSKTNTGQKQVAAIEAENSTTEILAVSLEAQPRQSDHHETEATNDQNLKAEWTAFTATKVVKKWFDQSDSGWTLFANELRKEKLLVNHPRSGTKMVSVHRSVFARYGKDMPTGVELIRLKGNSK